MVVKALKGPNQSLEKMGQWPRVRHNSDMRSIALRSERPTSRIALASEPHGARQMVHRARACSPAGSGDATAGGSRTSRTAS